MRHNSIRILIGIALSSPALGAPLHYGKTDVGSLSNNQADGASINNAGVVVGQSLLADNTTIHGFRSNVPINPSTDDLGVPTGFAQTDFSTARGINEGGQVIAQAIQAVNGNINSLNTRSYLLPAGGKLSDGVDIGTLGGNFAYGLSINESGQVAGWSSISNSNAWHGFVYTPGSGMQDLGSLDAGFSPAYDINSSGQAVGILQYPHSSKGFRTQPGLPIKAEDDLGTLGGDFVTAKLINDSGQVAGFAELADGNEVHLFRTQPNAAIDPVTDDLGTVSGSASIEPFGMNALGDIVGSTNVPNSSRAFIVYGDSKSIIDLNDLIDDRGEWVFMIALDINDKGQILAEASLNGSGPLESFVLTPIPEPSCLALVTGATMLSVHRRARGRVRNSKKTAAVLRVGLS